MPTISRGASGRNVRVKCLPSGFSLGQKRLAMDSLIKISGSSGLMDNNTAQRCWRDVQAISSHVVMNWDVPAENFGRMEFGLGLNPAYPMF